MVFRCLGSYDLQGQEDKRRDSQVGIQAAWEFLGWEWKSNSSMEIDKSLCGQHLYKVQVGGKPQSWVWSKSIYEWDYVSPLLAILQKLPTVHNMKSQLLGMVGSAQVTWILPALPASSSPPAPVPQACQAPSELRDFALSFPSNQRDLCSYPDD